MRLKDKYLGFVVNFLLGVAWASIIIGVVSSFLIYFNQSPFTAIIYAFVGAIPGTIGVLLLEVVITQKEKHVELQKQTKLLEQLISHK